MPIAVGLLLIMNFIFGHFLGEAEFKEDLIKKCQKTHNVYECEVKAVPVVKQQEAE